MQNTLLFPPWAWLGWVTPTILQFHFLVYTLTHKHNSNKLILSCPFDLLSCSIRTSISVQYSRRLKRGSFLIQKLLFPLPPTPTAVRCTVQSYVMCCTVRSCVYFLRVPTTYHVQYVLYVKQACKDCATNLYRLYPFDEI